MSGLPFFLFCKGQCPGTSREGDWRNRSDHCEVWKALYATLETELQEAGNKHFGVRAAETSKRPS